MKTLTEKYNGVLKETFSKDQFLRDARLEQPQLVTQHNSYQDAVNILLNRGLISEVKDTVVQEMSDINDPVSVKLRAALDQKKAPSVVSKPSSKVHSNATKIKALEKRRAQIVADMEQEAEPQGGPVADQYGAELDKIDRAIAKLRGIKSEPTYDQAIGRIKEDLNPAVDEAIFELWDQYVGDDREGISVVHTDKGTEFSLETNAPNFRKFILTTVTSLIDDEIAFSFDPVFGKLIVKSGVNEGLTAESDKKLEEGDPASKEIDKSELTFLRNIYKNTPKDKIPAHIQKRLAGLEGSVVESSQKLKVGDELKHVSKEVEVEVEVTGIKDSRVVAKVLSPGTVKGVDMKKGHFTWINPREVGVTWKKVTSNINEEYTVPKPEVPLDALDHGVRFELDKKGLDVDCTVAEYLKAKKTAIKNLEKDLMHYHKLEGASEMPVSKTDQMVKAKLKESIKYLIKKVLTEGEKPKKTFTYNGKLK